MGKGGGKKNKNNDKGAGGAKNQKKCTCDHPYKCDCGNRPERPSKGHKWDPETQQWGGKGHKQKGGSGQTTVVGQAAKETSLGKTQVQQWQRLPSQLLSEICKKQKRPPPKFKELKDKKVRCIVPDPKDSDKDLILIPAHAVSNPEQAKEESALLALLHLTPNIPHERKLPEPYKTTWLTAVDAMRNNNTNNKTRTNNNNSTSGGGNKGHNNKATANTKLQLATSHISSADRKRQQQQKRQLMNARIRKHEAIRMANRDHPVFLSAKLRQQIQNLLKGDNAIDLNDNGDDDENDPTLQSFDTNQQAYVEERLHHEGFTKRQARTAYEKTIVGGGGSSNSTNYEDDETKWEQLYDDCLQWLCIHLDEDQLPEGFDPRGETLEIVGGKKASSPSERREGVKKNRNEEEEELSPHGQALMKKYGLTSADTRWLLQQQQLSSQNEDEILWKRISQLAEYHPTSSNNPTTSKAEMEINQQTLEEEMEALDAIFTSECCSVTPMENNTNDNTELSSSKIVINTPEDLIMTIILTNGKYPSVFPQQVLISSASGTSWPNSSFVGIGLHVELLKFIAQLTPGEPMIFEIYGQMQQLIQCPEEIPGIPLSPSSPELASKVTGNTVVAGEIGDAQKTQIAASTKTAKRLSSSSSRRDHSDISRQPRRPRQRNVFWSTLPINTPKAIAFNKNVNKTIQNQRHSLPASTARADFITILRNAEQVSIFLRVGSKRSA